MSTLPGKEECRQNLKEMVQVEIKQAQIFAEIIDLLTEPKHEKIRELCQKIHQDELRHAAELEKLIKLL